MAKPEEYGISVRLVQEDGEAMYEASVTELPDLRTYGETYIDAYTSALEVIQDTQAIFEQKGKAFPDVEALEEEFSGRVTLRMSKSLHRAVHFKAQRDGVSLNQWLVEAAAARVEGDMISPNSVVFANAKTSVSTGMPSIQLYPSMHLFSVNGASVFTVLQSEASFAPYGLVLEDKKLSLGVKHV